MNSTDKFVLPPKASSNPSTKSVLGTLQTENPTWKLPERRVSKFLKKQIKKREAGEAGQSPAKTIDDDDEESVASRTSFARRVASGTKKRVGSVFRRGKKKGKNEESSIPKELQVETEAREINLLSTFCHDSETGERMNEELTKISEAPEKEEVIVIKEAAVYEDDNDGTEENKFCGGACACVIL